MHADRAEGHIASSAVAALDWDVEEAVRQVDLALQHDRSASMLTNATVTFGFINRPDLGENFARTAVRMVPSDHPTVDLISGLLIGLGKVSDAAALQSSYLDKYGDHIFAVDAIGIATCVADANVDEEWIASEISIAREVLSGARLRTRQVGVFAGFEPDGAPSIVFDLKFRGSIETEFKLEGELASKLAATESWNPNRLSVNISYLPEDADSSS